MDFITIIGPWIELLIIVALLVPIERWIHRHMYGVGFLLTEDNESATVIYYLFFFPGVFLHEFIQYLLAGALNVPIKKIEPRPQPQVNGTLRYNFVVIDESKTDRYRAILIAGLPFLIGLGLMWYISVNLLDLTAIPAALGAGDMEAFGAAIGRSVSTPDFWLWLYVLLAISNGMIPGEEDREGWILVLGAFAAISALLIFIGAGNVVVETLGGPVRATLRDVNAMLISIVLVDIAFIFILGVMEGVLERIRGYQVDYHAGSEKKKSATPASRKREPGSDIPLPAGELMPSIYNLLLPVPEIPTGRPGTKRAPAAETGVVGGEKRSEERPAFAPAATGASERPAFSAPTTARPPAAENQTAPLARPAPSFERRPPSGEVGEKEGETAVPRSPFSRPSAPVDKRSTMVEEEAEAETAVPRSPFSRPSASVDKRSTMVEEEAEAETAVPRSPFSRPASPFDKRSTMVEEEPPDQTRSTVASSGVLSPEERRARIEELRRKREEKEGAEKSEEPVHPSAFAPPADRLSRLEQYRQQRERGFSDEEEGN